MALPISFRDYVDARGENAIRPWVEGCSQGARARLRVILDHLAGESDWRRSPYVEPLKGPGKGLLEIKFINKDTQYRPLICRGPGAAEATFLIGAIEEGDQLMPRSAIKTAQARKKIVSKNMMRTCAHDYV